MKAQNNSKNAEVNNGVIQSLASSIGSIQSGGIRSSQQNNLQQHIVYAEVHRDASQSYVVSYRDKVRGHNMNVQKSDSSSKETQLADASTQTEKGEVSRENFYGGIYKDLMIDMKTFFMEMFSQLNQSKGIANMEKTIATAWHNCFDNGMEDNSGVHNKVAGESEKRYPTRQRSSGGKHIEGVGADRDSAEEGVISSMDSSSENEGIFETVEKRQIKVNPSRNVSVSDFTRDKYSSITKATKTKKKKGKASK